MEKDEIDPFIDMLVEYVKRGGGYIQSYDTPYLCDLVEKSRIDVKNAYHEIYALVTKRMKTDNGLDRHKQGACFMIAVVDGLYIPEDLTSLEVYRGHLAVWAGVCMMVSLFAAEEQGKTLLSNGKIKFPDKIREQTDYIYSLEYRLEIACEHGFDRGILALFLASELFFIESHNKSA